jgi:hypothetical protein
MSTKNMAQARGGFAPHFYASDLISLITDAHAIRSVASPSFDTGTLNWAAKAAVFFASKVEEIISQSPPIGSLTTTVMGLSLWLRVLIS